MSDLPEISIVIATYNRAGLIGETIESIFGQRFQNYELIVVDDGSTDDTRKVLEAYGSRLRYVYQHNRGPSAARNLGVSMARAPWISIQDSDDLCKPDHLESLYREVSKHPEIGMVFANGDYLGGPEHGRSTVIPRAKSRRLAQKGVTLSDFFEKSILRLQAALISKQSYDAVGGHDEGLRICMDLDLCFRLFFRDPVVYLDRVVFSYRKHEGNIGRDQERRLVENLRVIEKLLHEHPSAVRLLGRRSIARRSAYRYYRLAKGRWKNRNRSGACEAMGKAATLCPYSLKYRYFQMRFRAQSADW